MGAGAPREGGSQARCPSPGPRVPSPRWSPRLPWQTLSAAGAASGGIRLRSCSAASAPTCAHRGAAEGAASLPRCPQGRLPGRRYPPGPGLVHLGLTLRSPRDQAQPLLRAYSGVGRGKTQGLETQPVIQRPPQTERKTRGRARKNDTRKAGDATAPRGPQ